MTWLLIAPPIAAACVSVLLLWLSVQLARHRREPTSVALSGLMTGALFYSLGDVTNAVVLPLGVALAVASVQMVAAGLAMSSLFLLASPLEAGRWRRFDLRVAGATLALALVAAVPGVGLETVRTPMPLPQLDTQLYVVPVTLLGNVGPLSMVLLAVWVTARHARSAFQGTHFAGIRLAAAGVLLLCVANDTLVVMGLLASAALVSVGILAQGIVVVAALLRDYLDSKTALEALNLELASKIERRSTELAEARSALARSEQLASLGRLCAGVAHEVNNPAAAIRANLEYLQNTLEKGGALPSDAAESLGDSLDAVVRISRIVKQLVDSGRVASKANVDCVPLRAQELVARVLKEARDSAATTVRFESVVPSSFWLSADAPLLTQVLQSLVGNAVHSIAVGGLRGHIVVSARQSAEGRAELVVQDDGPGITEANQSRLFDPFFTTRAVGQGSGLGLTVARGLAHAMGGALELESSRPGCTRFVLRLKAELDQSTPVPQVRSSPARAPAVEKPAVLLVDDDSLLLRALVRRLSGTYALTTVATTAEALQAIEEKAPFAVVLCDVMMPDGGGARVLKELTERGDATAQRLLFMTGGAMTDTALAFVRDQEDRVLEKPFESDELERRLADLTRAHQGLLASVIQLPVGGRRPA